MAALKRHTEKLHKRLNFTIHETSGAQKTSIRYKKICQNQSNPKHHQSLGSNKENASYVEKLSSQSKTQIGFELGKLASKMFY